MDKAYKIAVASSDGIVVNQHFGRADTFYIYEIRERVISETLEIRHVEPVCNGGDHNDEQLIENIRQFQDCKYLLVSRIGMRAASQAEQFNIIPMELPGIIEDSIKKLVSYEAINHLFERD